MIIFDLDGTLADCEHRRHFVEPSKDLHYLKSDDQGNYSHILTGRKWRPDWQAFYEACDKDTPIRPVIEGLWSLKDYDHHIEIWSGRCESVRQKTIDWLKSNVDHGVDWDSILRMRPVGDSKPDDVLKERWLNDHIAGGGKPIQMVFDDRPKVIRMWRRRCIFVFNCCQHDEEF